MTIQKRRDVDEHRNGKFGYLCCNPPFLQWLNSPWAFLILIFLAMLANSKSWILVNLSRTVWLNNKIYESGVTGENIRWLTWKHLICCGCDWGEIIIRPGKKHIYHCGTKCLWLTELSGCGASVAQSWEQRSTEIRGLSLGTPVSSHREYWLSGLLQTDPLYLCSVIRHES